MALRSPVRIFMAAAAVAALVALTVAACEKATGQSRSAGSGASAEPTDTSLGRGAGGTVSPRATTTGYPLPPANAGFDYQIGDPYPPAASVRVLTRDHDATPVAGRYNICYVNGFQAQPEAAAWWRKTHPDLLLTRNGRTIVDSDWNEPLLDISTPTKRQAVADIVDGWTDQCATKGFQGLEVDNLDSWTRSQGALSQADAVAYATLLVGHAHAKGLAVGQKNTVEIASVGRTRIGFDFAVAEECAEYQECQGYVDAYGNRVLIIEYTRDHFRQACTRYGATLSIVLRDRDVTAPGSRTYVYDSC